MQGLDVAELIENLILILGGILGGGKGAQIYNKRTNGSSLECKAHCADHERLVANQAKSSEERAVQKVKVDYLQDGFAKIENKMDSQHVEVRKDIHELHNLIRNIKG